MCGTVGNTCVIVTGFVSAVLPSYSLEQLAKMQSGDPVLQEQSAVEECQMKTAEPPVGLAILPVVGPCISEVIEPGESEIMSPGAGEESVVVFHRSNRINKSQHSNPAHLRKFARCPCKSLTQFRFQWCTW